MKERIEKVQKLIHDERVAALIIDHPIDLYYLLGLELSFGRLVIEEGAATLFVDGRYFEACRAIDFISVVLTAGYDQESAFGKGWRFSDKRIGFDAQVTSYADFESLKALGAELIPLKSPIKSIREIKEAQEIEALKEAAELGSKGFDYVRSLLKEGVTEKEIALELELFWRKRGGERLAFSPHIAFGEGSAHPHYHVSDRPLKKGDLVLIDIGVVYKHYHSDMTRVLFFGEPNPELLKIYQIVHEAYNAAIRLCSPGNKIGDIDHAARHLIEQRGYKLPHGLGHGVGLEIHEFPRLSAASPDVNRLLQEGMVLTIEPGIYLPGLGGVRLEDTIVITKTGHENLTNRPL